MIEECIYCGNPVPDYESEICCKNWNIYKDCCCKGLPINDPICEECKINLVAFEITERFIVNNCGCKCLDTCTHWAVRYNQAFQQVIEMGVIGDAIYP